MNTDLPQDPHDRDPSSDDLLVQRYVDGELRAAERRDLEARLDRDPGLARRLDAVTALGRLFEAGRQGREDPAPLGLGFADRVWSEIRRGPDAAAALPALETLKTWNLVAASVAILLGASLLLWRPQAPSRMEAGVRTHEALDALDRKAEAEAKAEKIRRAKARRSVEGRTRPVERRR